MKLLAEISDVVNGDTKKSVLEREYTLRKSARAILRKSDGTIAVQHLQNHFFHKLPGGGVEYDETERETVIREIEEEVGCKSSITSEIGIVIEYRTKQKLLHISYCYVADVVGDIGSNKLEQGEIDEGMTTIWISPEEAILKMKSDEPNTYQGPLILKRELAFLEEYMRSL